MPSSPDYTIMVRVCDSVAGKSMTCQNLHDVRQYLVESTSRQMGIDFQNYTVCCNGVGSGFCVTSQNVVAVYSIWNGVVSGLFLMYTSRYSKTGDGNAWRCLFSYFFFLFLILSISYNNQKRSDVKISIQLEI